jgi:predicted metalloendopeptidase
MYLRTDLFQQANGNWEIKNKLQDSKTEPGPINKLKAIKRAMNSDQTTNKTHKSTTNVLKILNNTNTICEESCKSSWIQVSL